MDYQLTIPGYRHKIKTSSKEELLKELRLLNPTLLLQAKPQLKKMGLQVVNMGICMVLEEIKKPPPCPVEVVR